MKNMKKFLALALVIVSVLAIALPAFADGPNDYYKYLGGDGSSYNIRRGHRGQQVTNLQIMLNDLGYSAGAEDGVFGSQTEDAVERFQAANGLSQDGIICKNSKKVLWAELEYEAPDRCVIIY